MCVCIGEGRRKGGWDFYFLCNWAKNSRFNFLFESRALTLSTMLVEVLCMHMYVCIYVWIYVSMHIVCMYVCIYTAECCLGLKDAIGGEPAKLESVLIHQGHRVGMLE